MGLDIDGVCLWGRDYTRETREEALLAAGTGGGVSPPPVPLRDTIDGPRRPLTAGEKLLIREFRSAAWLDLSPPPSHLSLWVHAGPTPTLLKAPHLLLKLGGSGGRHFRGVNLQAPQLVRLRGSLRLTSSSPIWSMLTWRQGRR